MQFQPEPGRITTTQKTAPLSLLSLQAVEAKANIRVEWHESLGLSSAEAVLALKRQHHYSSTEEGQHEATRRINTRMQDIMRLNGFVYVAAAETDLNREVSNCWNYTITRRHVLTNKKHLITIAFQWQRSLNMPEICFWFDYLFYSPEEKTHSSSHLYIQPIYNYQINQTCIWTP